MRNLIPFLGLCLCLACQSEKTPPPNIILIMADDLGFETLSCNGSQDYETPRLDQLASEGMRFTDAYSTPLCTPSRVQLMTGKYNFRNYVGFGLLDKEEKTFAHYLKDAGYATAIVGKWQLWGNRRQRELFGRTGTLPDLAGFDEYCLWQIKEKFGERFKAPYLEINGDTVQQFPEDFGPDRFVDYAQEFISRKAQAPFFLYYPMVLTHGPFRPTPDMPDYYPVDSLHTGSDTTFFRDNVRYMDKLVGKLMDHLAAEGITENTLVLFIGDNGTDRQVVSTWESQRIPGRKGYPEEYGTHVPMIAYWKGHIQPGQVNESLVDFTDFLPTLLEVAGIKPPQDSDGLSFMPQLLGETGPERKYVFCDYSPQWGNFPSQRYVHDKEWKLYEDGRIFHIASDPLEKVPLNEQMVPVNLKPQLEEMKAIFAKMR